jgi:hypothetical protein
LGCNLGVLRGTPRQCQRLCVRACVRVCGWVWCVCVCVCVTVHLLGCIPFTRGMQCNRRTGSIGGDTHTGQSGGPSLRMRLPRDARADARADTAVDARADAHAVALANGHAHHRRASRCSVGCVLPLVRLCIPPHWEPLDAAA